MNDRDLAKFTTLLDDAQTANREWMEASTPLAFNEADARRHAAYMRLATFTVESCGQIVTALDEGKVEE